MSGRQEPRPAGTIRHAVVAGGSGAVGDLFTALLAAAGAEVRVADPLAPAALPPGAHWVEGDITAPSGALRAELARTDLLLLAVPEPVALGALPALDGVLAEGALLADTLSVKGRVATAAGRLQGRRQTVGLNPMFAPSLGLRGRPVAAVVLHDGPLVRDLLGLVAAGGGRVVEMDADRHDRLAAASQVLTHATVLAFGHALAELGADIEELAAVAPPPHAALLGLLARIASGTPEVYWDIQSANPLADRAREALGHGVDGLRRIVADGGEADFERYLHNLSDVFGTRLPDFRDLCAEMFAHLPTPAAATGPAGPAGPTGPVPVSVPVPVSEENHV
ncbi:hypothetical protein JCM4814A_69160 [Streptomyces phaeofaciens JCM 4814]|uniref:Prephenate/arogenate dehydrogenase domain-containing protein n=1 Tax=Streptomyces phaeofaciens TaxID=68254 RepID=A0A918LS08_9ACTN|nr:prephenate dehydrogenase dimerization domain-containing protein [Streptomyces phaeofaciens]GGT41755.1 hypothetical protein GCM10010226_17810 [Streptomyces phaeofaciens]